MSAGSFVFYYIFYNIFLNYLKVFDFLFGWAVTCYCLFKKLSMVYKFFCSYCNIFVIYAVNSTHAPYSIDTLGNSLKREIVILEKVSFWKKFDWNGIHVLEFRIPMEYNHPSKIYVKHYKYHLRFISNSRRSFYSNHKDSNCPK